MLATSVAYDSSINTTVIGIIVISEDFLGSPVYSISGSPLIASPPVSGDEWWVPPYPDGNDSNGDVFIVYDVVETATLNIVTRSVSYYGSPITGTASPFTPIWPVSAGSPIPPPQGSPKLLLGSPATYPNFGSPEVGGNTITIKSPSADVFLYGQEIEIRNASENDINRAYNIFRAEDLGGSPNLIRLTVLDRVLADTTNDGELVFTPDGFSGGDICGDVPPEILQTHWLEDLTFTWRFGDGSPNNVLVSAFQYFILEANSTNNTVVVQGDIRSILTDFGGSPLGSPPTVQGSIQHAVTAFGSPYESGNVGSPLKPLSTNNGPVTITAIAYDVNTNLSTVSLNSVSANTPTGWLISTLTPPAPPAPPAGAFVLAFGDGGAEGGLSESPVYTSDDDITTWTGARSLQGQVSFASWSGAVYAESQTRWVALAKKGSTTDAIFFSDDDGVTWTEASVIPSTPATGAYDKNITYSPSLDRFIIGCNSGDIMYSADGDVWTDGTGLGTTGVFGFSQITSVHWSTNLGLFLASTSNNEVGYSTTGTGGWILTAPEPGGSSRDDLVGIYSIGSRVFVSNEADEFVLYTYDITAGSPQGSNVTWTQSIVDIKPNFNAGTFAANETGSVLLWGAPGANSGGFVWRSTDNGVNFTRVRIAVFGSPGLTGPRTYAIAHDPDYGFMIGGENAIGSPREHFIVTSTDGLTWTLRLQEKFTTDTDNVHDITTIVSKNQTVDI